MPANTPVYFATTGPAAVWCVTVDTGFSLLRVATTLIDWSAKHQPGIHAAREDFDARTAAAPTPVPLPRAVPSIPAPGGGVLRSAVRTSL